MAEFASRPALSAAHRWALVALGTLVMALSFLDRQTLSALAPTVCADLGLSNAQYGWTGSAFAFTHILAAPLAGLFLDRIGVRRGLFAAVLAWSAVAAAHGLAAGFGSLLVLRGFLGVAEAPSFPACAQIARSVLPEADVPRGLGFILTGTTLGAIAALFIAVALQQRFGWRAAFGGVAAISSAWVALWIVLSSRGAAPALLGPAHAGSVAPGWSVFWQPAIVRAAAFTFLIVPAAAFGLLWVPKFLVARYGIAQADVARYGFLPPVAYDLGAIAFGDLAARARRRGAVHTEERLLVGASLLVLALGLLALPERPWPSILIGSVAFFGVGGAFAISTGAALVAVPRSTVSRAGAIIATANSLSFVVVSPLIGWSVDRTGSYRAAVIGLALLAVPAIGAHLIIGRGSRVD